MLCEKKRFDYFESELTGLFVIEDTEREYTFAGIEDEGTVDKIVKLLNEREEEVKKLNKACEYLKILHMGSMFNTSKHFKGNVSERYEYNEQTDTIYDTANTYGVYSKIIDKKEATLLLNEYNTLLENGDD